jgi:transcriptional adapter 3
VDAKSIKTKAPFSEQEDDEDILKSGSAAGMVKSPQQTFLPKNDTPQRFWNFVEPYCAPIQASDVKFLEDLIKGYNEIGEFYKVPGLGPHYSIRWAKEDLEREQNKSSEASEDDKAGAKFEGKNDSVPFGDLTQRLIQGLMEEKQSSTEDNVERSMEPCGSRNSFIQSLRVAPDDSLEKQLKKELEDMGILTTDEFEGAEAGSSGGDEVLAELERCQAELKAVASHNLSQLRNLANLSRVEMARQEIRSKLEEADNEVKDSYARISSARVKKRVLTKKEKDSAWKAIKDREVILRQLESV